MHVEQRLLLQPLRCWHERTSGVLWGSIRTSQRDWRWWQRTGQLLHARRRRVSLRHAMYGHVVLQRQMRARRAFVRRRRQHSRSDALSCVEKDEIMNKMINRWNKIKWRTGELIYITYAVKLEWHWTKIALQTEFKKRLINNLIRSSEYAHNMMSVNSANQRKVYLIVAFKNFLKSINLKRWLSLFNIFIQKRMKIIFQK